MMSSAMLKTLQGHSGQTRRANMLCVYLNDVAWLQTEDVGGVQGMVQEIGIALKGEAYDIVVSVKYPDPAVTVLDYGLMKVTQSATKSVILTNSGKYGITYAFHQRGAMAKELFSIMPSEGSLAPGGQQAVELTFNK